MTKLDAINQILAFVGEEPISDLETPDYSVNLIDSQFDIIKRRILSMGHSFNTDKITLSPDGNGQIAVASNVIKVRFPLGFDKLVVRNGYVWDNTTASNWSTAVTVLAALDIDFNQIPEPFQHWITLEIAFAFRTRLNGLDQTGVMLTQQATRAKAVALNSEPANSSGATGWGATVSAYGA